MRFNLAVTAQSAPAVVSHLRRNLSRARMMVRSPLREMSLVLTTDATMANLHQRYLQEPGPTDVLTFPLDVDERGRATSGEVYVCVPEARRRAREHGTRLADELLLYALHGMLHLSGFDDRTPPEFQRMHRTEDRILSRLGVGPVFQQPSAPVREKARARARAPRAQERRR